MRRILLYDNEIGGHHVQYIKYVLDYAATHAAADVYIVACLPEKIKELLNIDYYKSTGKIKFILKDFSQLNVVNGSKESFELQMLHDICVKEGLGEVLFMVLDLYFKAIALNKEKRAYRYKGIYFNVFLRRYDRNLPLTSRLTRHLRFKLSSFFWLMRSTRRIETAYILSDKSCYNKIKKYFFLNRVFGFVPEPVTRYDDKILTAYDLRRKYNIKGDAKVLLITGAIAPRKNIARIIRAVSDISNKVTGKLVLVIAGHIQKGLPDAFIHELENAIAGLSTIKGNASVVYEKDYLTDEALNAHIFMSDLVCIPYLDSYNSSAILYQSVIYKKILLGSNTGFMGEVIKKYKLGLTVNPHSADEIGRSIVTALYSYDDADNKRDLFLKEYSPLPESFAASLLS